MPSSLATATEPDTDSAKDSSEQSDSSASAESKLKLEIGDWCQVLWRDGSQTLGAVIVEMRPKLKRKSGVLSVGGNKKKKTDEQQQEEKDVEHEYYVHYVQHDRRLDEWISKDKFVMETLVKGARESNVENEDDSEGGGANAVRRRRRASFPGGPATAAAGTAATAQGPDPQEMVSSTSAASTTAHPSTFRLTGGNWHASGDPTLAQLEKEHEEITKVKNIEKIYMGGWLVESWYYSPYPAEYAESEILYVCEYCLKYMKHARTFSYHRSTCTKRRPPGTEIYRHDNVSVYEVDGKEARVYCQNLCLLAKLFLDHKTLYYDVDPFLFYVVCQVDEYGSHLVGYFSKEKVSAEEYNLACILTFPQYQKLGYGKFIISLSYELTKREETTGSPEKPLSDLGKISYRSYWTHILMHLLAGNSPTVTGKKRKPESLSIKDISFMTGIKTEDIISTLQSLDMIKCWKGQHVVFVKQDILEAYLKQNKQFRLCNPDYLKWDPPTRGARTDSSHGR